MESMYKGCLQCGHVVKDSLLAFCPTCGEALVMAFDLAQFGADGALELQQEYCRDHGIERDWDDQLHPRTDGGT
jgi:predicted  nucleic acid-binding Zn-ribbon protein